MSEQIKLLFDENFGEPHVEALAKFSAWYEGHDVEVRHLFRFAKSGEKDEFWVPRIAPGGWIVVSADRGRRCAGRILGELCYEHKVTHILLSASLHSEKHFEKIRAVIAVWPLIISAAKCEKGMRYSLRYDGRFKGIVLVQCAPDRRIILPGAKRLQFDGMKQSVHQQRRPKIPVQVRAAGEELLFDRIDAEKAKPVGGE